MTLTQSELDEVMHRLLPLISKALKESASIAQAQATIQRGVTQYIGARYVPIFADPIEWDSTRAYEPLTIVLYQGNSYTTRQYTPAGIEITNEEFWACTGNYNAQIELYRQEVATYRQEVATYKQEVATYKQEVQALDLRVNEIRALNLQRVVSLSGQAKFKPSDGDASAKIMALFNDYDVVIVDEKGYALETPLLIPKNKTLIGLPITSWADTTEYTFKWVGNTTDDSACISVQKENGLTTAASASVTGIHIANIYLDANENSYGCCLYGMTENCTANNITVINATKAGIVIGHNWYANFGVLVASKCGKYGILQASSASVITGDTDGNLHGTHITKLIANEVKGTGVKLSVGTATVIDTIIAEACKTTRNDGCGLATEGSSFVINGYYSEHNDIDLNTELGGYTRLLTIMNARMYGKVNANSPVYFKYLFNVGAEQSFTSTSGRRYIVADDRHKGRGGADTLGIRSGETHVQRFTNTTDGTIYTKNIGSGYLSLRIYSTSADPITVNVTSVDITATKTVTCNSDWVEVVIPVSYRASTIGISLTGMPSSGYAVVEYSTDSLGYILPNE